MRRLAPFAVVFSLGLLAGCGQKAAPAPAALPPGGLKATAQAPTTVPVKRPPPLR